VDCGTVSTGKRGFSEGNIPYIFRIVQWKNNGILFTKIGNMFVFSELNYLFNDPVTIFPIPPFNVTISTFIY